MAIKDNVIIQYLLLVSRFLDMDECKKLFKPRSGKRASIASFIEIGRSACFWCSFHGDNESRLGLPFCLINAENLSPGTKEPYMARMNFAVGAALNREGKPDKAVYYILKALAGAKRKRARLLEARCEFLLAQIYTYEVDVVNSLEALSRAIRIFDNAHSIIGVAACKTLMSHCYFQLGHHGKSYEFAKAAWQLLQQKQDARLAAYYWEIIDAYQQLGKHEECIEILTTFRKFAESLGHVSVMFDFTLAKSYFGLGRHFEAIELVMSIKASLSARNEDLSMIAAHCDDLLADIYRELGKNDQHVLYRQLARQRFEKLDVDMLAIMEDAFMCRSSGDLDQALAGHRKLEQMFKAPYPKWIQQELMGAILSKMGRPEDAITELKGAIDLVENIRADLLELELKESFLERAHSDYLQLIALYVAETRFQLALEYVERLKTRNLMDLAAGSFEVQGTTLPKLSPENEPTHSGQKTPIVDAIQGLISRLFRTPRSRSTSNNLHAEHKASNSRREHISFGEIKELAGETATAIIYFVPLVDTTVFFAISSDKDTETTAGLLEDCKPEDIPALVNALDSAAEASGDDRHQQIDAVLSQLNEKIYESLIPCLNGISNVIFVPYAGFHLLPLHAMFTEENGEREYVIDKFSVTYAPSAKMLKKCRSRDRSFDGKVFVGSANPGNDLSYSEYEAQAIADLFGVGVNRKLTRETLMERGRSSQIFHYAGHANGDALDLHGLDGNEDLYETRDVFRTLDLPESWLVTLSACQTGNIKIGLTDEYIGLPSAFLHAGAATVISSLWKVSDLSTTLLMAKMYQHIEDGCGKAESLRKAQLWLKNPKNGNEHLQAMEQYVPWLEKEGGVCDRNRFRRKEITGEEILPENLHAPYYWAGFICTGAP
jgi:CHAT domain-containing protein